MLIPVPLLCDLGLLCLSARCCFQFGSSGDLALLDPFDAPHHHFGLDAYELDTDADARAGLPPFVLPPGQTQCQSSMLAGGELFQCKEVECYAVNL